MSKLHIVSGNSEPRAFELEDGITFVGRSSLNDVQLQDRYVSSEHLMLRKLGDRFLVRDLGSRNGTFVNGNEVRPGIEVEVKEGAFIAIGVSVMCLGKRVSDEVLALTGSIRPSKKLDSTDTLVLEKYGMQPEKDSPKELGSNLTLGTWHSSDIQFSKSR